MSAISIDDVKKLSDLSALHLTDEQITHMQAELESILGYIDHLAEVDTSNEVPTYQVTGLSNVTRKDEIEESSISQEALLKNAPLTEKGQIKVPRVIV